MAATHKHHAFDILSELAQPVCGAPDLAMLKRFRDAVRGQLLAVAGRRGIPPREHAVMLDLRDPPDNASVPTLQVYVHEADARHQLGTGASVMAPFELVVAAAQRTRLDVAFNDGGSVLRIAHATLLAMRDLSHITADGLMLPPEQVMEHHDAIRRFAFYARRYCSRNQDVRTLHLATLAYPASRPLLAGFLSADHRDVHAHALTALSNRLFEPTWRFVWCEKSTASSEVLVSLRSTPPCYDSTLHQPWWRRLHQHFGAANVELICIKR